MLYPFYLVELAQLLESKELPSKSIQCTVCEFVINALYKSIGSNRSEPAVEAALEKICKALPHTFNATCEKMVHQFAPVIAVLVALNESAEKICDTIKLCNNGTEQIAPRNYKQVSFSFNH
jgi:hypothetical protein